MILSVIVPKKQEGMMRMLERELDGIDSEVIVGSWKSGIKKAQGSFVCLLEEDSAVSPGTIKSNLQEFISNPRYRKLAMVSPMVDFSEIEDPITYGLTKNKLKIQNTTQDSLHPARIGNVPGAVIRKASLLKVGLKIRCNAVNLSATTSIKFWNNGLRVLLNPDALYYAPESEVYDPGANSFPIKITTKKMWEQEFIS